MSEKNKQLSWLDLARIHLDIDPSTARAIGKNGVMCQIANKLGAPDVNRCDADSGQSQWIGDLITDFFHRLGGE